MKKLLILLVVFTLSFTLTGCGGEDELPTEMTMAELDEFMGRDDVQYIDLRNFDERMKSGYIEGFEVIPFFDYIHYQGILVKDGNWDYEAGEVKNLNALKAMFNMDKTILLMCGSGTRAQYVMDALLANGYTDVINIGGYAAYVTAEGESTVLGSGGADYYINMDVKGDYTPGKYVASTDSLYTVTVVINAAGGIQSVAFDAVSCSTDSNADGSKDSDCSTKQILGDDYNMVTYGGAGQEWYMQADELAAAIVANQGWNAAWVIVDGGFDLDIADDTETTDVDETHEGDDFTIDAVGGVSISTGGFQEAFAAALLLAE